MSPLDHKLARDLWRMKGQAVAIGLVIALGTLLIVMMGGLVNTLEDTRDAYYERYRLADIVAPVTRAPEKVLTDLVGIPGVSAAVGRISGAALVNLPGLDLPIRAQIISIPEDGRPLLNDFYLTDGRVPDPGRRDEVIVLEDFAKAQGLAAGDAVGMTLDGVRHNFTIVGFAQSPEFLYATPPGELLPDDKRFAVIWASRATLAAVFDLEGALNQVLIATGKGATEPEVIRDVDLVLDTYGGVGASGRADQMSDRFLSEEINGLKASSVTVPPIFLGVAAFLLFIVITRMIQAEREEIGLLKAFGYSSGEVAWHYLKFVLVIAVLGALAGSAMGIVSGRAMAVVYQAYYKFPFLVFTLNPTTFIIGFLVSVASAAIGSLLVLRSIFRLSPAVAMRPPTPPDYSKSQAFGPLAKRLLDQPSRMVLRRFLRHPFRMGGATLGIATGMALSVSTIGLMASFNSVLDVTFSVIDRSDATVTFVRPMGDEVVYSLGHVKGVDFVEPFRNVSAVFRFGNARYRGGISGLVAEPRLFRALDDIQKPLTLPAEGIVLSRPVADILGVSAGDTLTVEVRTGRRPTLSIPVANIAESLLGAPTYMRIDALNTALREPNRATGAYLTIDPDARSDVYRHLKDMPLVAGVALKDDSRVSFEKQMNTGAGAMRYIMAVVAGVIAFGIVYNSARIAFAERVRDLASLRVLGFTRSEAAFVLLGEIAIVTLLALPIGGVIGAGLSAAIARGFSTDIYQIPATFSPDSYGYGMGAVVVAGLISGWLVKRDLNQVDLVSALKTRE